MNFIKIAIPLALLVCIIIVYACNTKQRDNAAQRAKRPLPPKVKNDKIVIIKCADKAGVRKAIGQFCNKYNNDGNAPAVMHLVSISDSEQVITFPCDIGFDIFCYFVNYMHYPEDIFYKAEIKAWATMKEQDVWVSQKSDGKKVMLYIPHDDKEYDIVYMTTVDGIGYKLAFVASEPQLLDNPLSAFVTPWVVYDTAEEKAGEVIQ